MPAPRTVDFILSRHEPELNTGCWLWSGALCQAGYGSLGWRRRNVSAHRFFYEHLVGPIPRGLLLRHKCDTPACVNPAHLTPGTYLENSQDARDRGRDRRPKGEAHGNAKLTDEQIRAIRADTRSNVAIGRHYGVHNALVSGIKRGKWWKHVQ